MTAGLLIQGEAKGGKTGSFVSLIDAGFKLILCDFDGNPDPLLNFTSKPFVHVPFQDDLDVDSNGQIVLAKGSISAVAQFRRFLKDGNEQAGPPASWDAKTILVLDSLSALYESTERMVLRLNPGFITSRGTDTMRLVGQAQDDVAATISLFTGPRIKCHRAIITHLKIVGPQAEATRGEETELQKQVKQERAQLEETAYYPSMGGRQTCRTLARSFSTCLLYDKEKANNGVEKLVIRTKPIKGYTIGVPAPGVPDKLPIETGLLTIFKALGHA